VQWNRATGQVQRFTLSGLRWPQDTYLRWRRDGAAILFAGTPLDHPEHTALFQITLKGKTSTLVRHEWEGNLFVDYERRDGSLYYVIGGRDGQNDGQLMRRYPDGRLEELCGGIPLPCSVDEHGLLISKKHDLTIIQDLVTGAIRREAAPQDTQLSPNGQWSIRGSSDSTLLISRIK
jgi:hypothetical protein